MGVMFAITILLASLLAIFPLVQTTTTASSGPLTNKTGLGANTGVVIESNKTTIMTEGRKSLNIKTETWGTSAVIWEIQGMH